MSLPQTEIRNRIAEIGEILARGLVRLKLRQSSQSLPNPGESSLGFIARQSGHDVKPKEQGLAE